MVGILEKGHFVSNPGLNEADCEDYCDYPAICGGTAAKEREKAKKEKNRDVFDIFDRLKEYE
ncbi:MAG: hypothetical protein AB1715_12945 [Acidobacteriota bacterium]